MQAYLERPPTGSETRRPCVGPSLTSTSRKKRKKKRQERESGKVMAEITSTSPKLEESTFEKRENTLWTIVREAINSVSDKQTRIRGSSNRQKRTKKRVYNGVRNADEVQLNSSKMGSWVARAWQRLRRSLKV